MRFNRACLGGTFSPIHSGHRSLLERAFSESARVSIGLTSDIMAAKGRTRHVDPFHLRMKELRIICEEYSKKFGAEFEIREIDDPVGFALEPDLEAIVVSEETLPGATTINDLRSKVGLSPLSIRVVPIVLDERGEKLSSTSLSTGKSDGGD